MQFFLFLWDVSNKSWRAWTSSKLFQLINFANWNDLSMLFVQHLPPLFQQQNWQTRWILHFIYLKSFLTLYFHNGGLFEQYACVCTLNQSTSFNLPVNKPSIQISWNLQTGTTPNSQLTPFMQFKNNFLNFFYFKYILFQRHSRQ